VRLEGFSAVATNLITVCALIGAGIGIVAGVWNGVKVTLGFRGKSPKKALASAREEGRLALAGDLISESVGWMVGFGLWGSICGVAVAVTFTVLVLLPIFLVMG